jgi:hypothetical protein
MYEPGGPPLATLAAMPEWTAIGLAALASGLLGRSAVLTLVGTGLVCATAAVLLSRALRARLQPEEATPAARALVFWLSLAQPWVRRIGQLRKARALYCAARLRGRPAATRTHSFGFSETAFWTESTGERGTFLERLERRLSADGLPARRGSAFDRFDLEARGAPGARVLVSSVVEYHGGPKRLLRLRLQPRISPAGFLSFASGFLAVLVFGLISPAAAAGAGLLQLAAFFGLLGRVRWQAGAVLAGAIEAARESGFEPIARPESARPLPGQPEDRSIPKA